MCQTFYWVKEQDTVCTSLDLLWTYTLTVKRNNGDDNSGVVMMVTMTMIGIHLRRQCWLATDFNMQWKIVPPIAHLSYELREIKTLLLEGNNMHILWNTFLWLLNCGIFKWGREICCLPPWWMVRFQPATAGSWSWMCPGFPAVGAYWRSCHGIWLGSFLSSLGFGYPVIKRLLCFIFHK